MISTVEDTRYLNSTVRAANIDINPLEIPTRRASTTAVQAISIITIPISTLLITIAAVAVPSPKTTSRSEHLTGASTSTKTTSIFGGIDDNTLNPIKKYYILSSMHSPVEIEKNDTRIPEIIRFYNSTKFGIKNRSNGQKI
uniref:Uncharacterized protein n=1 Tax=Glossina austeni TaxID=7395 RepID=A0A1A9V031_GLOAU